MKRILGYLKPYYLRMAVGFAIKFSGTIVELMIPWVLSHMIDNVIPQQDAGKIYLWGGVMLLCAGIAVVFNIVANRMASMVSRNTTERIRYDLFSRVLYLSNAQMDGFTLPSLITRLTTDTYNVHQMLGMMQRLGVRAPIMFLGGIMITLTLDPVLTLVMLAVMPLIILILVAFAAMKNITYRLSEGWGALFLFLAMLVNAVRQICTMLQIILTKRLIESNHTLFTIAKYSSNYKDWFIYITLLIVVFIPIILWVKSFQVNEPYSNPAEHRKIRAKWRSIRRWSSTAAICLVLVVLNMTVISAYSNREVELSPIEDAADVDDENIYVSFDQVADGHLHRYAYVTENNVEIRFIVIKKPNSSAYGIGLDACDICGETGYYEKNGQVVCKLCDVVMNINTIGFKGGCNPIVIPYEIENGTIVVPISGLLEYEKEFK